MARKSGPITLDGSLADWNSKDRLYSTSGGHSLYGGITGDGAVFALESSTAIGAGTTIWLDTDVNSRTGQKLWGFIGGMENRIEIGSDGVARLYQTTSRGTTYLSDVEMVLSADGKVAEFYVSDTQMTFGSSVRVYADINNRVFLPGNYWSGNLIMDAITAEETPPVVDSGPYTIDGSIGEWDATLKLYDDGAGNALYGNVTDKAAVLALLAASPIGEGTTIWLDTDLDKATGYQIFGSTGGAEFAIEIDGGGTARLYSVATDGTMTLESDLVSVLSADGRTLELALDKSLINITDQVRVLADINDAVFLPGDYGTADVVAGSKAAVAVDGYTLDGTAAEWTDAQLLVQDDLGTTQIFADVTQSGVIFGIVSPDTITEGTTVWLDADMNRATGEQLFASAEVPVTTGADYNVVIGLGGSAKLYTGAEGETFVADLISRRSPDGKTLEFFVGRDVMPFGEQVRVYADVNDRVVLPGDYATGNLVVGTLSPVDLGEYTLDGTVGEWDARWMLYEDAATTTRIFGDVTDTHAVFALQSPNGFTADATIWLDSDLDRGTGYQIFGYAGGAEYFVTVGTDGSVALYNGIEATKVADLTARFSDDGTTVEFAIDRTIAAIGEQVRVFANVNQDIFLPGDFSNGNLIAGELPPPPPVAFGAYTLDGSLAEWEDKRLLAAEGETKLYGDVTDDGAVFAVTAAEGVKPNTTIWLDADLNKGTGFQVFGAATGAEYNVVVGADGQARLYSGAEGETFIADLDTRYSADGTVMEIAISRDVADFGNRVRVYSDVNDTTFLPGDYSNSNVLAGDVPVLPGAPDLKVGILYSATTAAYWFDKTAYGQLVMTAQSQAMQSGLPYDLLDEADMADAGLLATYDVLVFPGFSHVQSDLLDGITAALEIAQANGTSFIASGNFLTNDETGAAIAGNSYARMQQFLGVTLESAGTTEGLSVVAGAGSNPILDGFTDGAVIDSYTTANSYLNFRDATGTAEVLFNQLVTNGGVTEAQSAVFANAVGGNRNVHFSTDALIANSNLLHEAIDWAAKDDAAIADMGLQMTRGASLFYSRNDMDTSQEYFDVVLTDPGIYDVMMPIVKDWYAKYDFVGSYYINVGANPPDLQTDWGFSNQYYNELLAMGNEIGTHSYTHPENTNLLESDSPRLLELLELVDPRNPNHVDPWTLSDEDRQLLEASFRFQFETSKYEIEQQLGITTSGAAVPGAPEKLDASLEMIRFFDYLSGGYAAEGAGYPGAFGYLTPDHQEAVYLAPNMSFDFSLFQFQGLTAAEAAEVWYNEYMELTGNADSPILAFPWHDYGPTEWMFDGQPSLYAFEVFENLIAMAHADGTEFVTGEDLAARIKSFEASELTLTRSGDTVTANLVSSDAGHFSIDVGQDIASVTNWYAWNGTQVFTARNGGTFDIQLGTPTADITKISDLSDRMELIDVTGDGKLLSASVNGRGSVTVDLATQGTQSVRISGADAAKDWTGGAIDAVFNSLGDHSFQVTYGGTNPSGSSAADIIIAGSGNDVIKGNGGADYLVGGAGSDDFYFRPNMSGATILDFEVGVDDLILEYAWFGPRWDSTRESTILRSFQDFEGGTQFYQDGEVFLTLMGVSSAQLTTGDIAVSFSWF